MIPLKVKEHLDEYINQEVYVQIAIIKGKEKISTNSAIDKYFNSNHFKDLSEGKPYDHFIDGLRDKCLGKLKDSPMKNKQSTDKTILELQDKLNNLNDEDIDNTYWEIETGEFFSSDQIKELESNRNELIEKLDITEVEVTMGLFLGGMFPFLFAAMTINAVGRAAFKMIEEVRRQFNEIPGLREGKEGVVPDYTKCVDIATTAALKEMLLPGGLAIALPLIIGFWDKEALGGFLAGSLVTGFLLAIFMANSGGAWDNAKKYIEAGGGAGKGSDEHKAAVIGDTIGDPFKDTSGPAMNIVIKVMTIVSLIFASAF